MTEEINEWFYFIYANLEIWLGDMPSFTEFFDIYGKWNTNGSSIFAMNIDDPYIIIDKLLVYTIACLFIFHLCLVDCMY